MKILASLLVATGNDDLAADLTVRTVGTLAFSSGTMSVLEPMTYFTHIDHALAACRIAVPGPAEVTAVVDDTDPRYTRPFAMVLTFSDAPAVVASTVGEVSIDVARVMFADSAMLATKWVRSDEDYDIAIGLGLEEALERSLLAYEPIYAGEKAGGSNIMLSNDILTTLTGWGDGTCRVVRHDDAQGGLVRIVVSFLDDDLGQPIDFLDFGLPAPLALAA